MVEAAAKVDAEAIVKIISNINTMTIKAEERDEEATTLKQDKEEISLLMVCHMKEEIYKNLWYLDYEYSNYMSGDKSVFSTLEESFRDSVKFRNNSKIAAMGKRKLLIQTKRDFSQTIVDVLSVLDLKTNLLSISNC
ncbi:hypothetical protein KY290_028195 [Solanum tuberosum]|uniref:Retrovirus-related Pol polyprotein from transposon TNT 1-94-like beta-barrel domain-containing protein n=1 Tax=Solanum tuberosum TaxID=4113 RepID=A0ABQ7UID9_SOLTU|nr:hypothetical protein KY290_028195 [Solanum tuberosum]